jgi:hypothetical protein
MKKYFFGILSIVLAAVFCAFTNTKEEKKTLTYTFAIDRPPISEEIVEAISNINGKIIYTNWDKIAPLTECSSGQQKACSIIVDEKYTQIIGFKRYLNAEDPDGIGLKEAFPTMDAIEGLCMFPHQFYIVNNPDVGNDIDVRNGTIL